MHNRALRRTEELSNYTEVVPVHDVSHERKIAKAVVGGGLILTVVVTTYIFTFALVGFAAASHHITPSPVAESPLQSALSILTNAVSWDEYGAFVVTGDKSWTCGSDSIASVLPFCGFHIRFV